MLNAVGADGWELVGGPSVGLGKGPMSDRKVLMPNHHSRYESAPLPVALPAQ